jgi:NifB/MoaA-like Fe-S oxidoreductase
MKKLNEIKNLEVSLIPVSNDFFGNSVTVTGLLTGHDLIMGLSEWRKKEKGMPEIFITSTMHKFSENVFLDNMTVPQVEKVLNCKINVLDPTGTAIIKAFSEKAQT